MKWRYPNTIHKRLRNLIYEGLDKLINHFSYSYIKQVVTVEKGGKIQDAIDSLKAGGEELSSELRFRLPWRKPYRGNRGIVLIPSGVYDEGTITVKPWVSLSGIWGQEPEIKKPLNEHVFILEGGECTLSHITILYEEPVPPKIMEKE